MATRGDCFQINVLESGVTRVALGGDVDASVASELQESLEDLVHEGHTRLLVDLSDVSFIDSTALGVLLHTVKELRRRRGRLAVLCPDPKMRELFELVGHNLLFPVDESLDEALRHLRPRRRFGASPRAGKARAGSRRSPSP
jgi:anti-sigma B factor antagonist